MLFGGSNLGYGIVIGTDEEKKMQELFKTDSSFSEIVEHDLEPLLVRILKEKKCHPNNIKTPFFKTFCIKDGTFLMLNSSSQASGGDDNFTPIMTENEGSKKILQLFITDIESWVMELFQEHTEIDKDWTWALVSDFY